jgi:hypothetical protein
MKVVTRANRQPKSGPDLLVLLGLDNEVEFTRVRGPDLDQQNLSAIAVPLKYNID